jgi:hypothetical protein
MYFQTCDGLWSLFETMTDQHTLRDANCSGPGPSIYAPFIARTLLLLLLLNVSSKTVEIVCYHSFYLPPYLLATVSWPISPSFLRSLPAA